MTKAKSGPTKLSGAAVNSRAARHKPLPEFLTQGRLGAEQAYADSLRDSRFSSWPLPKLAISQMSEPIVCSRPRQVKYFLQQQGFG